MRYRVPKFEHDKINEGCMARWYKVWYVVDKEIRQRMILLETCVLLRKFVFREKYKLQDMIVICTRIA